ncbi:hypothetical protein OB905_03090 [Halobacteria archaeon AArc-dxtr1]|nr:hypothetical protein [Halobacteria archaeon AArc-dxtr1]
MNRRRLLGTGGTLALAGLAGCLDDFREHFEGSVGVPIPIEIFNAGSRTYNVNLNARDSEMDRETYDQSFSVRPDEQVGPGNLEGTEQQFRVTRFDDSDDGEDLVEAGTVTTETQLVRIVFDDDSLDLDIRVREPDDEIEDATPETGDNESTENGDDPIDEQ